MLSISIVTCNNANDVGTTVTSIYEWLLGKYSVDMWLIDNNSSDATPDILKKFAETVRGVRVVKNNKNLGYGKAHNIAIASVQSKYHIICNPDIVMKDDSVERMIRFMDANLDVGLLAPKVLNVDGTLQYLNRRYPTILDLALRRSHFRTISIIFERRMARYEMRDVGYEEVCDVPSASGSFMFCRTSALKHVGGFDDRYFMYFEDYDLARAMQASHYRTIYYPWASVVHRWERAAHKSVKMSGVFIRNGIRYFNKWGWKIF